MQYPGRYVCELLDGVLFFYGVELSSSLYTICGARDPSPPIGYVNANPIPTDSFIQDWEFEFLRLSEALPRDKIIEGVEQVLVVIEPTKAERPDELRTGSGPSSTRFRS